MTFSYLVDADVLTLSSGCFQVSKYFSEIFKKLAPQGHAVLVMKKGEVDQQVSTADLSTVGGSHSALPSTLLHHACTTYACSSVNTGSS